MAGSLTILHLAPHPDDEAIGAPATLLEPLPTLYVGFDERRLERGSGFLRAAGNYGREMWQPSEDERRDLGQS